MNDTDRTSPEGATTYNAGTNPNPWTEIKIKVSAADLDLAGDIAQMTVPYGIYIEDYRTLEEETREIAHIDLIEESLLKKDRSVGFIHVYLEPGKNPAEAIAFLRERYQASRISSEIEVLPCKREDWQNNWKKYAKPLKIGSKLFLQPVWQETPLPAEADGRKVLYLEPGLAFGTGSHETTRLCLEELEASVSGGESVLDLGCGSGILSIAALLLGADSAVGVDIDALAVDAARENGARNGFFPPVYTVHCGDMAEKITGKYDLVVANIVADVIVPFCKSAKQFLKENAYFLLSGILNTREDDVKKAFSKNGFRIVKRRESGEWLCFVLQARPD